MKIEIKTKAKLNATKLLSKLESLKSKNVKIIFLQRGICIECIYSKDSCMVSAHLQLIYFISIFLCKSKVGQKRIRFQCT